MNRNGPECVSWCVLHSVDVPSGYSEDNLLLTYMCLFAFTSVHVFVICTQTWLSSFLQFDEEFSARQEAQAESQKKEEKIKELEEKIQALESQVNPQG